MPTDRSWYVCLGLVCFWSFEISVYEVMCVCVVCDFEWRFFYFSMPHADLAFLCLLFILLLVTVPNLKIIFLILHPPLESSNINNRKPIRGQSEADPPHLHCVNHNAILFHSKTQINISCPLFNFFIYFEVILIKNCKVKGLQKIKIIKYLFPCKDTYIR